MSSAQGPGDASQHSTRQEVAKLPHTICRRCGLSGVSAMVKEGTCVNSAACERRQRRNDRHAASLKRQQERQRQEQTPGPLMGVDGSVGESSVGLAPELEQLLAQMDAEIADDVAKEKAMKKRRKR